MKVAALVSSPAERELFGQLIEAMTERDFDLTRYRDHYIDGLATLIERRMAETAIMDSDATLDETGEAALVAALRASLSAAGVDNGPARMPSRTQRTSPNENETAVRKLA